MSRLTSFEVECRDILAVFMDAMAAGHPMKHYDHTELLNRVRKAYFHLENKEYGCMTGLHSGPCHCPKGGTV